MRQRADPVVQLVRDGQRDQVWFSSNARGQGGPLYGCWMGRSHHQPRLVGAEGLNGLLESSSLSRRCALCLELETEAGQEVEVM